MSEGKKFGVKIEVDSDITGSKDALDAINDAREATEKSGDATGEHTRKSRFFNLEMGETKKLVRELGEDFPVLGIAVRLAMNPVAEMLTLAITLFSTIKGKLDELNKSLDETDERLKDASFAESMKSRTEALIEAASAAEEYARKIREGATAEEIAANAANLQNQLLAQQASAVKDSLQAREELEEAGLKNQLDAGVISMEQYYTLLLSLHQKYLDARTAMDVKARAEQLKITQTQLDKDVTGALPASNKRIAAAEDEFYNADSAYLNHMGLLDHAEKNLPAQQTERDAQAKDIGWYVTETAEEVKNKTPQQIAELRQYIENTWGKEAAKKVDAFTTSQTAVDKSRDIITQYGGGKLDMDKARFDRANKELDAAREEGNELADTIKGLRDKVADMKVLFGDADKSAAEINSLQHEKNLTQAFGQLGGVDIGGGFTAKDLEHDANIRQHEAVNRQAGRDPLAGITQADRDFQNKFEAYLKSRGDMTQGMIDALSVVAGSGTTMATKLGALQGVISKMQKEINDINSRASHTNSLFGVGA